MRIYQVGGSVRDQLLGLSSQDEDWVVVGARPEHMLSQGFTQVGADFPVFLHPHNGQEYALARTERKTGKGYLGFEVKVEDVTLEEDLLRRDLTINAMARGEDGVLVDPYGGQKDLERQVLRHVSDAFREDPVRILRVLRFLARFGPEWTIAAETKDLMYRMVRDGEADHLVPERIWKEMSRALMEPHPWLFVRGLADFGLTSRPAFHAYRFAGFSGSVLREATQKKAPLAVRVALMLGDSQAPKQCPAGVPADIWKATLAWSAFGSDNRLFQPGAHAEHIVNFLEGIGAFRSRDTLHTLVGCWRCIGTDTTPLEAAAIAAVDDVDTKAISASMPPGPAVGKAIRDARIAAVQSLVEEPA